MTDSKQLTGVSRRNALKAGATGMAWLISLSQIPPSLAHEFAQMTRDAPMTGARLAGILQTERTRWNALLAQIDPARMEEPGVEGAWSLKELIAHLTWYEARIVEGAQQILNTGTFTRNNPTNLPLDERNAYIAEVSRARPLSAVLAESEQVFQQLLAIIAASPEQLLNDAQRFGLPGDIAPWMAVANNSYAHYREHEASVRAWLARIA